MGDKGPSTVATKQDKQVAEAVRRDTVEQLSGVFKQPWDPGLLGPKSFYKPQANESSSGSKILSRFSPVASPNSLSDLDEKELALNQETKKGLLENTRKMNCKKDSSHHQTPSSHPIPNEHHSDW